LFEHGPLPARPEGVPELIDFVPDIARDHAISFACGSHAVIPCNSYNICGMILSEGDAVIHISADQDDDRSSYEA
jgi:hypothetical protein